MNEMKKTVLKVLVVLAVLGAIMGLGYFLMNVFHLNSIEDLRAVVDNSFWGVLIFGLILILQVLILPAGTLFFTGAAVLIFENPFKAWLICWIFLAIGSFIMFFIARIWGVKVLKWVVGQQRAEKYAYYIEKGKFVLPLIFLVPIFPDDIVCAAAGLSKINWLYFMVVVFITRGIDNFCTVFIGASLLKSTVGIIILIIFVILMIIASYFLTKYQDKIEKFFLNLFTRKNKKQNITQGNKTSDENVDGIVIEDKKISDKEEEKDKIHK